MINDIDLLCGFCDSKLILENDLSLYVHLICPKCGKESVNKSLKSNWYSYLNNIRLESGDVTVGTDLSYIVTKNNKVRNKIRRLFEGNILSSCHIDTGLLKEEDAKKIHFWNERDSSYCRIKSKKYVNREIKGEENGN